MELFEQKKSSIYFQISPPQRPLYAKEKVDLFLSFAHPIDLFKQKKKSCVFGLKKSGRGSSSSGSSGTNRSADVSNIICLTACVFGLKKKGGVEGRRSPPRGGGWGGAEPKLLTCITLS